MEKQTRVYPAERPRGGFVGKLILFLSALVILSGLFGPAEPNGVSIRTVPSSTPIPLDETFDETITEAEFTLPSSQWFSLQLGAFETEEAAQEIASQFIRRGAGGYVWQDGRYRTLAAVYPSRDDAQMVRQRLLQQHRVETYLYEISLPAMQLRLTGMKGQMEILQAAFLHADDLIHQLYMLSSSMDRQEISVSECCESLSALDETLQAVWLRMNQRFAKPRHEAVNALMELFQSYSEFVHALHANESAVTMGANLKQQTLSSLHMLKHVYDTISHT